MGLLSSRTYAGIRAAAGLPGLHGIALGVIKGIGGGLIRDTLTNRDTLLLSPELYATPIIVGLTLQFFLQQGLALDNLTALVVGGSLIFAGRSVAIIFNLRMPAGLVNKET